MFLNSNEIWISLQEDKQHTSVHAPTPTHIITLWKTAEYQITGALLHSGVAYDLEREKWRWCKNKCTCRVESICYVPNSVTMHLWCDRVANKLKGIRFTFISQLNWSKDLTVCVIEPCLI